VLVSSSQKGPSPSEQFSRIHGCVMVSIWVCFVDAWRIEERRGENVLSSDGSLAACSRMFDRQDALR
jgi:hypothetical protein